MRVALAERALVALALVPAQVEVRELGFNAVADLHDGEIGCGLQNRTGDDVADAIAELLEDLLARALAHKRVDGRLGVLGGDAARILGSHVLLGVLGVLVGLLVVGFLDGNALVHIDLARSAIDRDLGAERKVQDRSVAIGERLLELVDERALVDMLLLAELCQCLHHLGCHGLFPFLPAEVDDRLQRALLYIGIEDAHRLLALELKRDGVLVGRHDRALETATSLGRSGGELAALADETLEVARTAKRAIDAGRGDLERVGARYRVDRLNDLAHPRCMRGHLVERERFPLGSLDANAHARGLGGTSELNVNDVDAVLGRELLELVDDELLLLALDHATPPQ